MIAAIRQMIAPKPSANGVPQKCATAPASRLPIGIIAPKTSDQTPITRPRISSGTSARAAAAGTVKSALGITVRQRAAPKRKNHHRRGTDRGNGAEQEFRVSDFINEPAHGGVLQPGADE